MEYEGYFLIVVDFINWAKLHYFFGLAAAQRVGLIIAYAMNITSTNQPYLTAARFPNL